MATKSLDPHTLARLKGLQLRARHIVEGYVAGLHRSPYHGFSIEFAEHREYVAGDDLRFVDWKVFGKTDKYYLKQFEDETNLICNLVVDTSESMLYHSEGQPLSKWEYAHCLAASLAWLVLHQQDAVSLVTFDQAIRGYLRPSSSPAQLKQTLQMLETAQPGSRSAAGPIFHDLAQRWKKRGVVIVISDAFDQLDSFLAGLKHFRYRQHDVALLHVLDPAELEFPFYSPTMFAGLEDFPEVQADPLAIRSAYIQEIQTFCTRLEQGCRSQQVMYLPIRTDQPVDHVLASFLHRR